MDNVRGKHVYIIQPTCRPVNDNFMQLILSISAAKRAGASKVTCIVPYFGYARQDRKAEAQVPISAGDVTQLLESAGCDHLVAVDLHCI